MKTSTLSPTRKIRAIEMAQRGYGLNEIVKILKTTKQAVRAALKEAGFSSCRDALRKRPKPNLSQLAFWRIRSVDEINAWKSGEDKTTNSDSKL